MHWRCRGGGRTHTTKRPHLVEYSGHATSKPPAERYFDVGGQIAESSFRCPSSGWPGANIDNNFAVVVHVSRKRAYSFGIGCFDGFRHETDGAQRPDRSMVSQAVGLNRACAQLWVSLGRRNGTAIEGVAGYAVACLLGCWGVLPGKCCGCWGVKCCGCWGVFPGNTVSTCWIGRETTRS